MSIFYAPFKFPSLIAHASDINGRNRVSNHYTHFSNDLVRLVRRADNLTAIYEPIV
jgi:hypothetical protein